MNRQTSLFSFDLAAAVKDPPVRRPQPAARRRMTLETCPVCGERFPSFVPGVKCDDCRKIKRAETSKRPPLHGQVSAYGWVDVFPPGF